MNHSLENPAAAASLLVDYTALRSKVDGFAAAVSERRPDGLACRSGCAACCAVELAVSDVEAAAIRDHLAMLPTAERRRLAGELAAAPTAAPEAKRCVMLLSDDRCAIYAARPLVCRSQGLPLLYPAELVPEAAQRGVSSDGKALTCCPLNFTDPSRPPLAADLLDAERVDVLLALVNRRYAAATAAQPLSRTPLADLLREFVK